MISCLGVSRTTWSNYENGKTNPSIEDLIRFSKFFGITLDELVLGNFNANEFSKHTAYKTNDMVTIFAEPDLTYVLQELKKIKAEINTIKKAKK